MTARRSIFSTGTSAIEDTPLQKLDEEHTAVVPRNRSLKMIKYDTSYET